MRPFLRCAALVLAGLWAPALMAQAYPTKPIKIVIGYPPGGAVDVVARTIGQSLSASLGQAVVIEHKPGASTNIAVKAVISAEPDGHTLMLAANALASNMALFQPPPFDAERDLAPIALIGRVPVVLAAQALAPFDGIGALLVAAKAKPKTIAYGSPGNGSTPHLAVELFAHAAGISLQHIPYRGGAPAITDVLGGQLPLVAVNALEVWPHVKNAKLKVLAVLSPQRSAIFPDVPTIAESGFPGFEASVWYGLLAPSGTPPAVLRQLHEAVQKGLQSKDVREKLTSVGGDVTPGPTEALAQLIRSERQRYTALVRQANIKPD